MRYTKLRTWAVLLVVVLAVIVVLNYSGGSQVFKSKTPVTDSLITKTYPQLYEAISKRNAQLVEPFLTHENTTVREQAWRALTNTPVDSIARYINLAAEQQSKVAWFGISKHSLTAKHLRALEQRWQNQPDNREGITLVLGRQGNEKSLQFLLDELASNTEPSKLAMGLAIGRLVVEHNISENEQVQVIQKAFQANNYKATKAYLYGWYRGDAGRLTSTAKDTLFARWQLVGSGVNTDLDQYINKMLPERTTSQLTIYYNGEQELESEIQLSVELAKSLSQLEMTDKNSLAAKILLTNANPHVQVQALRSLKEKVRKEGDLYNYISQTMLADEKLTDVVWIQALSTAMHIEPKLASQYSQRLGKVGPKNPYLWPQVLKIYTKTDEPDAFLQRISSLVAAEESPQTMYALQGLNTYWQQMSDSQQTDEIISRVRTITFEGLGIGDRGVAYMAQSLLKDEKLFSTEDFNRINGYLQTFSLPSDIEVYQVFGTLYKDRFAEQAKPIIDSLASLNYVPLNRSLDDAGWEVTVPNTDPEFRMPNWQRLWELGRKPVWTVETEKGNISIELDPLTAPATVSMIDSLSRAGAYDGVPYHRVVPNFVIQGGDIERRDGFGGPDFVIPTEASDQGFVRGAMGIASAGTDTEGSQYFIMHQWKPHLNGSYTRFGKVVDGMEVVDKIIVGDKVEKTTWF